jgi:peptidyl-prolyl cis-trans isomerase B (cyclophilin B)
MPTTAAARSVGGGAAANAVWLAATIAATAVAALDDVGFPLPDVPYPTHVPSPSTITARVDEPPTSTARNFMVAVACPGVRWKLAIFGFLAAALTACGGDDDDQDRAVATTASGCLDLDQPAAREDGGATAPTDLLDPAETWTLTFDTSCGAFVVTLDPESAPAASASLVALADAGFYDNTVFHRIVPGFVIQGGDPTQSGGGGPGYQTVDVPAEGTAYTHGVVAMAKAGPEPAGTAGSQFFVVTGADVGLPPDYAVVGEVTAGLDVVDLIGTLGDPATERPTQPVVIESVTAASS